MIRNFTPGLLLRHGFYLAFGAFCGVAFLGGLGVIPGAALGLTMDHYTLKWRKQNRISYDNLNRIFTEADSSDQDKKRMDLQSFLMTPEGLRSDPRILSPLMAHEILFFATEIIPIHFLFLFSFERLFLTRPDLYSVVVDALRPVTDLFFQHYDILNVVFASMDNQHVVFLKTAIFLFVAISGFALIYGILKQFRDVPRYHAWVAKFIQKYRIELKTETRTFLYGGLALVMFLIVAWPKILGYSDTKVKPFFTTNPISEGAVNVFPSFYYFFIHFPLASFSSVLFFNLLASGITTFYWVRRQRKFGPG